MTIQDIGLFQAMGAKMDYLNQRHSVIARNVAHADTPGYRPKDLKEADFSSYLKGSDGQGVKNVSLRATDDQHVGGTQGNLDAKERKQKEPYEVAPAGNSVIMEEQLLKSGQNAMEYNLMLSVYQKQVGMFRTALGSR